MVEVVAVGAVPVAAAPVNPSERIDAIDVLRGIALFGVLAINVVNEFRVSIFEEFLPVANTTGTLDRAVQTFLTMAVELKAHGPVLAAVRDQPGHPSSQDTGQRCDRRRCVGAALAVASEELALRGFSNGCGIIGSAPSSGCGAA
jgi:hypothetical protein